MICPILSAGWLANPNSAHVITENTFREENLVKCKEKDCVFFDKTLLFCRFINQ